MPLYEYRCPKCRDVFEVIKSIEKRHDVRCPKCDSKAKMINSKLGFFRFFPNPPGKDGFTSKYV